jgi:siroheme synthase-like protein
MLDVTERLVVIIGGGGVASRKANGLLDAGATRVRMVALSFGPNVPGAVQRVTSAYEAAHLDGAGLVFAATDSADVNDAVLRDARARHALACRADADDEEPGDFVTPARLARGPVVVTVSAGSAALSAAVRDGLANAFDERWARMAEAMRELRPRVRASNLDQRRRAEVFRDLASAEAFATLAAGGAGALGDWIAARYPELNHG